jgi:hypothetical protein
VGGVSDGEYGNVGFRLSPLHGRYPFALSLSRRK